MVVYQEIVVFIILGFLSMACSSSNVFSIKLEETQLTFDRKGHTIHNTQVFSPDDQWIVYDTRNADTLIGSTALIELVNIETKEIRTLYRTTNQSQHGPGVGAATFSPVDDQVIFIHGIRNAGKKKPYGITRRTGVSIHTDRPFHPIFMDARDITPPFTAGALRGGTHAHTWSGDGEWISFTYNDHVIKELSETDSSVQDLRMIGVMVPKKVEVEEDSALENNSGEMFSVVVSKVTENPQPGSDEIDRAFDEGWIGNNGYLKPDGSRQEKAIAFQGDVRDEEGNLVTEVFVVDLPEDPTIPIKDKPLAGTLRTRPNVPKGVIQRRVTFSERGIQGPRHWLRSTPDGDQIAFLALDSSGVVQIHAVSPNGGEVNQITFNPFPVQGPFNFSPDGKFVAYAADNSIFLTDLVTKESFRISERMPDKQRPMFAPVWSNKGDKIAYMRYVKNQDGNFLQIFMISTASER